MDSWLPSLFAYFEYLLTWFVPQVVKNDGCLDLVEHGSYGWPTIFFQRTTVIVTEIVLFLALQHYIDTAGDQPDEPVPVAESNKKPASPVLEFDTNVSNKRFKKLQAFAVAGSIALSPGLLIIDHIHFQYNGFMYGILVFSLVAAMNNKPILSGFCLPFCCVSSIFIFIWLLLTLFICCVYVF